MAKRRPLGRTTFNHSALARSSTLTQRPSDSLRQQPEVTRPLTARSLLDRPKLSERTALTASRAQAVSSGKEYKLVAIGTSTGTSSTTANFDGLTR